ncbi:hypothetical protein C1H71_19705 [Iodobacter fluviatilis]|uniref:Uncharacterized protein n=1 Tax=Iodobacter fluviatilis TaxID=537 RepID=A0A7G3GDU8_9NEIS|nr:hypothetical protein C1H71_19705 [Iodobacter fluviatilis]
MQRSSNPCALEVGLPILAADEGVEDDGTIAGTAALEELILSPIMAPYYLIRNKQLNARTVNKKNTEQ